jgi:dolichol-phosphate mannosyltransferase
MIYVVLPVYNEERIIRTTLLALWHGMAGGEPYRAVVVDDGSSDRSVDEAERAATEAAGSLPLTVLRHPTNRGLGAGLRTGIAWCLGRASDDDVVVTLDADNTQPPALIPALVARLRLGYDVAIASRYRHDSVVRGVPAYRRAISGIGRLVFQTLFPIPGVRDYTSCFRAYRVRVLRQAWAVYGDDLFGARGFEAVMDLLLRLRTIRARAIELGFALDYGGRVGQSKMKVLRTIRTTLRLLARRFVERLTTASPGRIRARLAAIEAAVAARPDHPGRAA